MTNLFSDFTGWLTLGILGFMFVMMGFLLYLFVNGGKHDS